MHDTTQSFEFITYSVHDSVATLTLNRPDKLNSLMGAMMLEVFSALGLAAQDNAVKAVVLTGAGRAFCAGQDLADPAMSPKPGSDAPADIGDVVDTFYSPLVRRLRAMPKPVVCAVNGVAAGAGANIALACDIVIAVQTASFIQPFCKLGLVPDAGGTWLLPQLVGRARAMGLALLGDKLSAEQAAQWGLIWKCVATADFEAEVHAIARTLAAGPTLGYLRTRQAIDAAATSTLDAQLDLEAGMQRELGNSLDYAEGVKAFIAKRPPVFVGQ
jgi:2-(1,2-epoxy-1,2-dihydrophenyl)acetyl-CoA isomerase